jgi:hypothetical protein
MANSLGQDLPTGTVVVMRANSPDGTTSRFRIAGGCGLTAKLSATEISGTWLDEKHTPDIVSGLDIDALATLALLEIEQKRKEEAQKLKEREVYG